MTEYETTFEKASIWAVVWRFLLIALGVVIIGVFLLLAFMGENLTLVSLITDGLLYFSLYKLTLTLMKRQSLSVKALSRPASYSRGNILNLLGLTALTAFVATSFMYFIITFLTFFPQLFDRVMPYILDITLVEDMSYVYLVFVAVVFAPIVEELFFRGYILNKWADKYGVKLGVILSSLAFMIIHLRSVFIPQLLVGLICGLLYVKYNNLLYAIFFHALYNLFVILPSLFIQSGSSEETQAAFLGVRDSLPLEFSIFSLLFLISFAFLIYFLKNLFKKVRTRKSPYAINVQKIEEY
ncbi:lysostaphin resistance A-like protein [Alkalibacterium sp.]|nr:MAG: CPBP family intramembrane metalloprotease [Alkalibacterium sp.]